MLRILLAVVVVCAFGLGGCRKKEPTIGEQIDQVKQEAEQAAEEAPPAVEKAVEDAQKTAEEATK
ncbi:MAG: hypothetical protein L0Y36_06910 [Planctomycetales bacterium]|nr:hypothetical protein [Planctomycetales bacterium]